MYTEESIKRKLRFISWPLVVLSILMATISYMYAGSEFGDALYRAFDLFGFSSGEAPVNLGIRIARWLAPASVATALIVEIAPLFRWVRDRFAFLLYRRVIYSDTYPGVALFQNLKHRAVLAARLDQFDSAVKAKSYVIMMSDDTSGLSLYSQLYKPDRNIKLCLNQMEPNLIPSLGNTQIFNINDLVAGAFWQNKLNIFNTIKESCISNHNKIIHIKIAIIGYEALGKRMLYKGLLLNLFSVDQSIEYLVFGDESSCNIFAEDMLHCTELNGDEVTFCYDDPLQSGKLADADYIIITGEPDMVLIQKILYTTIKSQIYCYDPDGVEINNMFASIRSSMERNKHMAQGSSSNSIYDMYQRLHSFGVYREVISKDKIYNNRLDREARDRHEEYISKIKKDSDGVSEQCINWDLLDGFRKGSNINACDYEETAIKLIKTGLFDADELAELEHIRWCRYHFLNHWKYAPGEKNPVERTRSELCAYAELDEKKKEEHRCIVERWDRLANR